MQDETKIPSINRLTPWEEYSRKLRVMLYHLRQDVLACLSLMILIIVFLFAVFGSYLAPYPEDASTVHFERAYLPPSAKYIFGTDNVGRDILSRVILGTPISLSMGVVVVAIAIGVGVPLGLIAGYVGGIIGTIIMRATDLFLSIPPLVLALAVCTVIEPSLQNLILALAFTWWPWYARLTRGEVLSVKEELFVDASRSIGAGPLYIAFKEILPNILSPIVVKGTIDVGYAILAGSTLGFLGLGIQPPTPEWGTMLAMGRSYLPDMWWLTIFPASAIFMTVLAFNLFGDSLRDILDIS